MAIEIDVDTFQRRLGLLMQDWKASRGSPEWGDADALCVVVGAADDDLTFLKSSVLHSWLLGYEFTETILLITADKAIFHTSPKKAALLDPLTRRGAIPVEIFKRTKDETQNQEAVNTLLDLLGKSFSGKKLGGFPKDRFQGKMVDAWTAALKNSARKFENVDVSNGVSNILAVKEDTEIKLLRTASRLSSLIMKKQFVLEMMEIIEEGKKMTHEQMTNALEKVIESEDVRRKYSLPTNDIQWEKEVDWCYPPIIQSGGKYDLRLSAMSNNEPLHEGTIIASFGIRYKSYCSNIARTYMTNANKTQEKNYKFLLELQQHVLASIKAGVSCSDVYKAAMSYIGQKRPDLQQNFVKNCGWGVGIELREPSYVLSPKHHSQLKAGMTLCVMVGFQNLSNPGASDPRGKTYALSLADTVMVTGEAPVLLTDVKKEMADVSFDFDEEQEEEVKAEPVKNGAAARAARASVAQDLPERKGKRLQGDTRAENESRRNDHQKSLHEKLQTDGLRKYQDGEDLDGGEKKEVFKKFASYKTEAQLPKQVTDLKIFVDHRNESIILPFYGQPVPFHISTLKNVSKSEEQDYIYLRFNFLTPGVGKKELSQPFEDPNATFIRALSFRSSDTARFMDIYKEINDLKKDTQKRDVERKEKADLVEQDMLVEVRGRRPVRLPEVFTRPQVDRRFPGDLEIHQNGIRYVSQLKNNQKIDVLFSNIRHIFFQPCDHELIVILHFHLKNPIMIGKKKTQDVQFYREVTDAGFDETGNRGRARRVNYGDEDELAMEAEERRRRAGLNKEFKGFAEKIQDACQINVEIPFRELGFQGVFSRQLVLIQPTTECLVHLTDIPNLVLTLDDIELVHLERVQFGLKNFDMVFVFKDFNKPVRHINTIPVKQLDNIKEWLDGVDIPFTEGPANLSWAQIMKTVIADPAGFFETGGWSFLQPASDDDDSEEEISEFEMDESDFAESDDDDDSEGYSEGGGNPSDEDEFSGSGSEDESGEDWDELERKAAKADAMKGSEPAASNGKRPRSQDDRGGAPSKKRK
ncbi:FACT complex subunit-domain-containing protein [Fimicolochytrium jonesii]|uniref:FACT complex subunit-domain-containing protein n=1 Tax=Fimicolochytrium jonesii TaxID=1396493 RepID=UPI0022FDF978|nr:FACT complex subunit-domain-containing protein [Fimicolochytrium jonesii]KAI8820148.1 FACT complex subunit-domain-containing protein [Fimicolochytrium jonesii]